MAEGCNVGIERLIVHILDSSVGLPVLSKGEHPEDGDAAEFIGGHIQKIFKDDNLKTADFTDEKGSIRLACEDIISGEYDFTKITSGIAEAMYDIMESNPDIPPADLVCCTFRLDDVPYLGILKLNYRTSYIHNIANGSSGNINSIVKQRTALPGETQRIDECALINLTDLSINLIEKKYEINGEKLFYFSTMVLKCSCQMSDREKVRAFKKATDSFKKKYIGEDFEKSTDMKKAIARSLEEEEAIDVVKVAEDAFRRYPDMRDTYIEHMEKSGLKDMAIVVRPELKEKEFKKQKLKTDTGIELELPIDYYKDRDKIEFISNGDGSISIILKNINSIKEY